MFTIITLIWKLQRYENLNSSFIFSKINKEALCHIINPILSSQFWNVSFNEKKPFWCRVDPTWAPLVMTASHPQQYSSALIQMVLLFRLSKRRIANKLREKCFQTRKTMCDLSPLRKISLSKFSWVIQAMRKKPHYDHNLFLCQSFLWRSFRH